MILVQDIVKSMAAKLDAETPAGTTIDYYTFDNDYKYAINDAIEWATSIITPMIGTKKFSEVSPVPTLDTGTPARMSG